MVRFDPAEKCQQGSDPPEIGPEEMDRMGKCQPEKSLWTTSFETLAEDVSSERTGSFCLCRGIGTATVRSNGPLQI
jgi:hypothetical protein